MISTWLPQLPLRYGWPTVNFVITHFPLAPVHEDVWKAQDECMMEEHTISMDFGSSNTRLHATPSSWFWIFCSCQTDRRAVVAPLFQPAIASKLTRGKWEGRVFTWLNSPMRIEFVQTTHKGELTPIHLMHSKRMQCEIVQGTFDVRQGPVWNGLNYDTGLSKIDANIFCILVKINSRLVRKLVGSWPNQFCQAW